MPDRLAFFSLLVPDHDAALDFFLPPGFELREDSDLGGGRRWVRIGLPGAATGILLARAVGPDRQAAVGRQGGGRVWLFLETGVLARAHAAFAAAGVAFVGPPRDEPCGRVAVFRDPRGKRRDLIAFAGPATRLGAAPP